MNSLLGYGNGSDDDYDDSPEEKPMDSYATSRSSRKPGQSRQEDVNYDEVQMSLSEDSSDESKPARVASKRQSRNSEDARRATDKNSRSGSRSIDDHHSRKERTDKKDDRYGGGRSERDDDRSSRHREEDRSTKERYRGDREEEKVKERRDDRRGKSKDRYSSREDRYRDKKDRKRSRSPRDRERRRSRSPKRSRSRSKSKDRSTRGSYSKRYERASSKMERLDKMGIEIKGGDGHSFATDPQHAGGDDNKDRFFVPGITGRFREQIEKRKLLWQKKEPEKPQAAAIVPSPSGPRATKVWEATTFAQDTDGKVANKFKRLMGIKNAGEGSNTAADVLKKQEEMFSSMEQQYEVARTATHTMRGVGLGFGSYQR